MISRGHYFGEILDDLTTIVEQVKLRNRLNLTDLSVYAENFFRDVLNILLSADFKNLNTDRSNEPGLDLGCATTKIAVQITATGTSEKVNKTLAKITTTHQKEYDKFVVLLIGKGQSTYALDPELSKKLKFGRENIWDINTLARQALSLELDDLQRLHRLMRKDSGRLRIELELPDEDGNYPTSGYDEWEKLVAPKLGNGKAFIEWSEEQGAEFSKTEKAEIEKAIKGLGNSLSNLPRITREFFAMLHERRDTNKSKRSTLNYGAHLVYSTAERIYNGDLAGELQILEHQGFVSIDGDDPYELGAPEIQVRMSSNDYLNDGFIDFVKEKNLSFRSVIGNVDLSAF
jgi:hypothetical protein